MEYLSPNRRVRQGMMLASIIWGLATLGMLIFYPGNSPILVFISMGYTVLYFAFSVYRTLYPPQFPVKTQQKPQP
jgi:hypothetical protein